MDRVDQNGELKVEELTMLRELVGVLLGYARGAPILRTIVARGHLRTCMEFARCNIAPVRRCGEPLSDFLCLGASLF